jgi:Leucine-rich repeat (LRR) protein
MVREGNTKEKSRQLAVVNEHLIRECIYVPPPPGEHEESSKRSIGGGLAMGLDKTSERADARRKQIMSMELHHVTCLMCGFKGISRIANFVGVDNLVKLYLDNNNISKIENLKHLKKLQWLDLSFNHITVIENLESLTSLEDLSLYANEITVVQGLEKLTKLTCLSLGRNKIEQLEETARYLHGFKALRMLTLAGNKIDQQGQYKQKLLGYVPNLKYLDSRLVFKHEVQKARDDLKEHLIEVDEADAKEEAAIKEAKAAEAEAAEFIRANAPNEAKLLHEVTVSHEPADGRSIRALLELDAVKDRMKECIEEYREGFSMRAKELADKMKDLRRRKDKESQDFTDTLNSAKDRCDEASRAAIKAFEKKLKKTIPFALRSKPDPDIDYTDALRVLHSDLATLRDRLIELEADQMDAYEEVIKAYEETVVGIKTEAVETLNGSFEALRSLEREYYNQVKLKLDNWFDERQRQQQDALVSDTFSGDAGHAPSGVTTGGSSKDKQALFQLIDNKDDYTKALSEWHEAHIRRLEENNEMYTKNEEAAAKAITEKNREEEHERNRSRISEIHAYIARMTQELEQWEQRALEAM